jgi:hypothetical protein
MFNGTGSARTNQLNRPVTKFIIKAHLSKPTLNIIQLKRNYATSANRFIDVPVGTSVITLA